MHFWVKKMKVDIYTHALLKQNFPQILISPRLRKVTHSPPGSMFFENLFPPQWKEGEEEEGETKYAQC